MFVLPSVSLDDLLSRSLFGTVCLLVGATVLLVGTGYGLVVGLVELVTPPPSGSTPAGTNSMPGLVATTLLVGSVFLALGGQFVWYRD